jgi:hypothetical protein
MDEENVREFGWAMHGEQTLHRELSRQADSDLARMAADPSKVFSDDWEFKEADRAVLARTDMQQMLGEAWREAFHNGVWGWVDDDLAVLGLWGSRCRRSRVPWWCATASRTSWCRRRTGAGSPLTCRTRPWWWRSRQVI